MTEVKHVYKMRKPTVSKKLNDLYQRACENGFGFSGYDKYFHIGSQETLDIINEVNLAFMNLKNEHEAMIAELELMESRHIQAALASKGVKQKSSHFEAANDARRILGKVDV